DPGPRSPRGEQHEVADQVEATGVAHLERDLDAATGRDLVAIRTPGGRDRRADLRDENPRTLRVERHHVVDLGAHAVGEGRHDRDRSGAVEPNAHALEPSLADRVDLALTAVAESACS